MKTKYYFARRSIIDRELSKGGFVKTIDLVKIIRNELSINVTQRTLENDLRDMQEDPPLGCNAPISIDTKNKAYQYTEPFSLRAFGLNEEHINALLFYSKTLHQYHKYKIFNNIANAIERVLDNFKINPELKQLFKSRIIIQAEKTLPIQGHEFIPIITQALEESKKLSFNYGGFSKKIKPRKLAPCLLKEDKHMWYILGIPEGYNSPRTFALDRISSLKILEEKFEPINFNPDEYFKYSFGVTVKGFKPIKVILSFSPYQGNYLKALPIHETQEIIVDDKKELRISVLVKPSYEFYSKILSYGDNVRVISPKSVVNEIKRQIQEAYQRYI
jgi:predicted DNA-binding transcriptional regulator YafY